MGLKSGIHHVYNTNPDGPINAKLQSCKVITILVAVAFFAHGEQLKALMEC
jgi:hypothetical protein